MNITQKFTETNNFYCNTETKVEESGYVMNVLMYGSVLAIVGAVGYGAFLLVTALVAWLLVAVPAFLTATFSFLITAVQILITLLIGYWSFMFLNFLINGEQKEVKKPTETEVIDVKVIEKPIEKREFSLKNYEKLSEI